MPGPDCHFDWLFEIDDGPLWTISTEEFVRVPAGDFDGEMLPDHRRRYLDYEGPLSNQRGHVARLASAQIAQIQVTGSTQCEPEISDHSASANRFLSPSSNLADLGQGSSPSQAIVRVDFSCWRSDVIARIGGVEIEIPIGIAGDHQRLGVSVRVLALG